MAKKTARIDDVGKCGTAGMIVQGRTRSRVDPMRRFLFWAALVLAACGGGSPPASVPTVTTAGGEGDQQIAELGTCALESGDKIQECRVGFRTYGKLNADKSNVILFPTWFTGTTQNLAFVPKELVDTKKFFLVLVDALGDGVSSAPSSSRTQPRLKFPKFSIHDMVESQRRLLRETLKIDKPITVMGISMGGMQSFEWAVSYPEEVKRIIPIVGTPQLTAQDLLLWNAELDLLDGSKQYADGEYRDRPRIPALQEFHWLNLTTPAHRNSETSRAAFPAFQAEKGSDTSFDWNDWHRQLEAMIAHDVARKYGGDLAAAAKRVKARGLVIVAEQDHMVNPEPSKRFAALIDAKLFVTNTNCGHAAPGCEPLIPNEVRKFLDEP
jgi:homoserine O-acetyltransferase